jgi:hypothetical protein
MGIPFPMGLKNLNQTIPNLLPWAWGVNGFASVVSSTAVVFMAVEFGFVAVLVIAMVVYTIAMVT